MGTTQTPKGSVKAVPFSIPRSQFHLPELTNAKVHSRSKKILPQLTNRRKTLPCLDLILLYRRQVSRWVG